MSKHGLRIHLLGLAHTVTSLEYSPCAFTQKVLKLSRMLADAGYDVIHYGAEGSQVHCPHVDVVSREDQKKTYGRHDWRKDFFRFDCTKDHAWRVFHARAAKEIQRRLTGRDVLFCSFGWGHEPVAKAIPKALAIEPGVLRGDCGAVRPLEVAWLDIDALERLVGAQEDLEPPCLIPCGGELDVKPFPRWLAAEHPPRLGKRPHLPIRHCKPTHGHQHHRRAQDHGRPLFLVTRHGSRIRTRPTPQ